MASRNNQSSLKAGYIWGLTRISLGLIFLWAFFDKLWGLGFATCRDAKTGVVTKMCGSAWVNGGSPTNGFLKFAAKGPFADFFHGLAGNAAVDWLFMVGLLGIGAALILGIGMRIASISGVLLVVMMYLAVWPPANNPFLDDHIVYALVLLGLWRVNSEQKLGLGNWWAEASLVKRFPILK